MSWFRAARSVRGPDGSTWEIYVSRVDPPSWRPAGFDDDDGYGSFGPGGYLFDAVLFVVRLPFLFVTEVLWPLLRMTVELPVTLLRGRGSQRLIVDAISFGQPDRRYRWTTTRDHLPRVLDQIERGLREGEVERPLGAVFQGGA